MSWGESPLAPAPREAREIVERLLNQMADFHGWMWGEVVNRMGEKEISRRARLPETLVRAVLRELPGMEPWLPE
jgi:hypothetical protein